MRLLELFCGTKSVGKVATAFGYSVVSVDINPKFEPTIVSDILKFDYKKFPPGYFHFIWASPPCTEFSRAKTRGVRDLKSAERIVRRTLKIIEYFKPKRFVIENPVGLMRESKVMKEYNHLIKTVSYCKYGFPYRKNTDLWTNTTFTPKKCERGTLCLSAKKHGYHLNTVQQGTTYANGSRQISTGSLLDRYRVPTGLIRDIFASV